MIKSILYDLYNGELYPAKNIIPTDPDYWPLIRKIGEEKEFLQTKLNDKDSERLEELGEMYVESSNMYGYENFSCGLKMGIQLMLEILDGKIMLDCHSNGPASVEPAKDRLNFSPLNSKNN